MDEIEVKKSKHNNIKVKKIINGEEFIFDSKLEAMFFELLLQKQEKLGIKYIELQKTFLVYDSYISENSIDVKKTKLKFKNPLNPRQKYNYEIKIEKNKKKQGIKYICDFILTMNNGKNYYIDTKGRETADFKLKKKMFESRYNVSLICVTSVMINQGLFFKFLEDDNKS